jgi:hypothetical protein
VYKRQAGIHIKIAASAHGICASSYHFNSK